MEIAEKLSTIHVASEVLSRNASSIKVDLFRKSRDKDNKEVDFYSITPIHVTKDMFSTYAAFHHDLIDNIIKKDRRVILGYDLRNLKTPNIELAQNLVELHKGLKDKYDSVLLCTYILLDNELLVNLINTLFKAAPPTKPVHLSSSSNDIVEFAKPFLSKAC